MEGKAYESLRVTGLQLLKSHISLGSLFLGEVNVLKVLVGTCNRKISIPFRTIVVLYSTCPLLEEKEVSYGGCSLLLHLTSSLESNEGRPWTRSSWQCDSISKLIIIFSPGEDKPKTNTQKTGHEWTKERSNDLMFSTSKCCFDGRYPSASAILWKFFDKKSIDGWPFLFSFFLLLLFLLLNPLANCSW